MEFIHLINDMPIVYVRVSSQTWGYELYTWYGEILEFATRREAEAARNAHARDIIELAA